jgi:hypothetical protein
MNTTIRNLIFTSTTALFACDSFDEEELDLDLEHDLDETVEPSPNGATELASESQAEPCSLVECDGTRIMVGILDLENFPNATCDPAGEAGLVLPEGWVWDDMFVSGGAPILPPVSALPPELRKFCMFTYVADSAPREGDYEPFFALMAEWKQIAEFGPDCMGMAAAGGMNGGNVRQTLRMAMLDNIQMPPTLPTCAGSSCPEVVVVDTQVGRFTNPDSYLSDHGGLVAGITKAIQGQGGREITYENAFPGSDGETSVLHWDTGGDTGSMATLALALFKSTWEFRAGVVGLNNAQVPVRSIVNISLGYLRELSLGYPDTAPAKALHAALQYASCSGQLVIASAGNNTDERCPDNQTGALAPAIFETEAAPTNAQCATLEFSLPHDYASAYPRVPKDSAIYNPLVFAVGGVDGQDLPLPNTRKGGQPRLVAYASNSLGVDAWFDPARVAMTGTSAAAAAVTGVASSLWGLDPELSGAELMSVIYEAGYPTGDFSDFQLGDSQPIHRLAYCPALAALCAGRDPSTCPTPVCSAQPPAADGYLDDYASATDVAISNGTIYEVTETFKPSELVCEDHDLSQVLFENPEDPACPHCKIYKGTPSVVSMDIIPEYKGLINDASITVVRDDRSIAQFNLDGSVVDQLNSTTVGTVIVSISESNVAKATLHVTIGSGTTAVQLDNGLVVYEPTGGN